MSLQQWLAIAAWLSLPMPMLAQQLYYGAADGATLVNRVQYESVFKKYHAIREGDASPDQAWRSANEEVGRLGGHAGYIKENVNAAASGSKSESHGKHHHD